MQNAIHCAWLIVIDGSKIARPSRNVHQTHVIGDFRTQNPTTADLFGCSLSPMLALHSVVPNVHCSFDYSFGFASIVQAITVTAAAVGA